MSSIDGEYLELHNYLPESDITTFNDLQYLRTAEPIAYSLIIGQSNAATIARTLMLPYNYIRDTLRGYKRDHLTFDLQTDKGIRWYIHPNNIEWLDFQDWVQTRRRAGEWTRKTELPPEDDHYASLTPLACVEDEDK